MTTQESLDALTVQTSALLDTCTSLKSSTAQLIAAAVTTSQNAAQIPLVNMATNLTSMQALLVTYIARG